VEAFRAQLADTLPLQILNKHQAFGFLHGLLNYAPEKEALGEFLDDRYIDFQLCNSALECFADHLRLDDYAIQVLTIKDFPSQSPSFQLSALLNLPGKYTVTIEWKQKQTS